ncbi:hypothetical protein BC829DRAFT_58548 [Chytridium lagenaria]|nr:hypothetical protein BC829DRAFT_58548 [Chytridium lagenaria]
MNAHHNIPQNRVSVLEIEQTAGRLPTNNGLEVTDAPHPSGNFRPQSIQHPQYLSQEAFSSSKESKQSTIPVGKEWQTYHPASNSFRTRDLDKSESGSSSLSPNAEQDPSSANYSTRSHNHQQQPRKGTQNSFFAFVPPKHHTQSIHSGANNQPPNATPNNPGSSNGGGLSVSIPSRSSLDGAAAPAAHWPSQGDTTMASPLQKNDSNPEWPSFYHLLQAENGTPPLPIAEQQLYQGAWSDAGMMPQLQHPQQQFSQQPYPYPNFHARQHSESSIPPSPTSSVSVIDSPPTFLVTGNPYNAQLYAQQQRHTSPLRQGNMILDAKGFQMQPHQQPPLPPQAVKGPFGAVQRSSSISSISSQGMTGGAGPVRTSSEAPSASPYQMSPKPGGKSGGGGKEKKRYHCLHEGCGKTFTTSGHLARHKKLHAGIKSFHCPIEGCPSRFARKDNMLQHAKSHYRRLAQLKKNENGEGGGEDVALEFSIANIGADNASVHSSELKGDDDDGSVLDNDAVMGASTGMDDDGSRSASLPPSGSPAVKLVVGDALSQGNNNMSFMGQYDESLLDPLLRHQMNLGMFAVGGNPGAIGMPGQAFQGHSMGSDLSLPNNYAGLGSTDINNFQFSFGGTQGEVSQDGLNAHDVLNSLTSQATAAVQSAKNLTSASFPSFNASTFLSAPSSSTPSLSAGVTDPSQTRHSSIPNIQSIYQSNQNYRSPSSDNPSEESIPSLASSSLYPSSQSVQVHVSSTYKGVGSNDSRRTSAASTWADGPSPSNSRRSTLNREHGNRNHFGSNSTMFGGSPVSSSVSAVPTPTSATIPSLERRRRGRRWSAEPGSAGSTTPTAGVSSLKYCGKGGAQGLLGETLQEGGDEMDVRGDEEEEEVTPRGRRLSLGEVPTNAEAKYGRRLSLPTVLQPSWMGQRSASPGDSTNPAAVGRAEDGDMSWRSDSKDVVGGGGTRTQTRSLPPPPRDRSRKNEYDWRCPSTVQSVASSNAGMGSESLGGNNAAPLRNRVESSTDLGGFAMLNLKGSWGSGGILGNPGMDGNGVFNGALSYGMEGQEDGDSMAISPKAHASSLVGDVNQLYPSSSSVRSSHTHNTNASGSNIPPLSASTDVTGPSTPSSLISTASYHGNFQNGLDGSTGNTPLLSGTHLDNFLSLQFNQFGMPSHSNGGSLGGSLQHTGSDPATAMALAAMGLLPNGVPMSMDPSAAPSFASVSSIASASSTNSLSHVGTHPPKPRMAAPPLGRSNTVIGLYPTSNTATATIGLIHLW